MIPCIIIEATIIFLKDFFKKRSIIEAFSQNQKYVTLLTIPEIKMHSA